MQALDPLSLRTVLRFLAALSLFILWAHVATPQSAMQALALMTGLAAFGASGVAFLRHEPLLGSRLNHWDESLAFIGVHYFVRFVA
jgi:hypothetical protein